MREFRNKVAFIIATKDRPTESRRLLESLDVQSHRPDQIVIVDGGSTSINELLSEFKNLDIKYLQFLPPSAARQRNMGMRAVGPHIDLVGFMDDDAVLEQHAFENMLSYWEAAPRDIGGCSFNLVNPPSVKFSSLKHFPLSRWIGLYSREKGVVMPSGWQTLIGIVTDITFVQWLPTTAVVWRREIFDEFQFDEWFDGYSYLEDLDFSYRVGKKYKLCVVAQAKYYHYPSPVGRGNGYSFGKREVENRIYFVKKHSELSLGKCYVALIIRMLLSSWLALREINKYHLRRALGNAGGLLFGTRAVDA